MEAWNYNTNYSSYYSSMIEADESDFNKFMLNISYRLIATLKNK